MLLVRFIADIETYLITARTKTGAKLKEPPRTQRQLNYWPSFRNLASYHERIYYRCVGHLWLYQS